MTVHVNFLVRRRQRGATSCPYCRDETSERDVECDCGVVYHDECRALLRRGCATLGCTWKRDELEQPEIVIAPGPPPEVAIASPPPVSPIAELPRRRSRDDSPIIGLSAGLTVVAIVSAIVGGFAVGTVMDPLMSCFSWSGLLGALLSAPLGVGAAWLFLSSYSWPRNGGFVRHS